jgi:glutamyl-tRNA reductase
MTSASSPASRGTRPDAIVAIGANHRNLRAGLRDRLFIEEADLPAFLARLREAGAVEALVLSTCDRVEVFLAEASPSADSAQAALELLAARAGDEAGELRAEGSRLDGVAALRHLFRIAASLESQVIGEPQVLGQVKAAERLSRDAGLIGPVLGEALQGAYGAAKRVRSETAVAQSPVSMAAAAVSVARDLHGDLRRVTGLLLGAGEMGELLAAQFREVGMADIVALHPNPRRAAAVARRLGVHSRDWTELGEALVGGDVVMAAVGRGDYVLTHADLNAALRRRRRRPIFVIDAAVPSDVEPRAQELDDAFIYDLGDLERVARAGQANREDAARAASDIVEADLAAFLRSHEERGGVPALRALRQHVEALRTEVLSDPRLDAEEATRRLVSRLLHDPSAALRRAAAGSEEMSLGELQAAIRRLFALDEPERKDRGADGPEAGSMENDET